MYIKTFKTKYMLVPIVVDACERMQNKGVIRG